MKSITMCTSTPRVRACLVIAVICWRLPSTWPTQVRPWAGSRRGIGAQPGNRPRQRHHDGTYARGQQHGSGPKAPPPVAHRGVGQAQVLGYLPGTPARHHRLDAFPDHAQLIEATVRHELGQHHVAAPARLAALAADPHPPAPGPYPQVSAVEAPEDHGLTADWAFEPGDVEMSAEFRVGVDAEPANPYDGHRCAITA